MNKKEKNDSEERCFKARKERQRKKEKENREGRVEKSEKQTYLLLERALDNGLKI